MALEGLGGKVAVVTGAAGGIGRATAARLAAEGASVVVVDADDERAVSVAGELGPPAIAVAADVSREEDVEGYVRAAAERFGRVDLHHLNAGIAGSPAPIPELTASDFDEVIAVNLRGVFLGLRAAFRQFEAQGSGGSIVATASISSVTGSADLVPYHASKHGVVGLTRSAAVYGGPIGVRVNAVAPGIVLTGLLAGGAAPGAGDAPARARRGPLGRVGTANEVAALVAFLLSDEAAYATGGIYPVDGGAAAMNPLRPWGDARRAIDTLMGPS